MNFKRTLYVNLKSLLLFLFFFSSINSQASPLNGSGELRLSDVIVANLYEYISKKHGQGWHYVVSTDGLYSNYTYCADVQCTPTGGSPLLGVKGTILKCEKRSKKKCYVLARRQKIVWNNLNLKIKSKISLEDFKKILGKHNFIYYEGVNNNQTVRPGPNANMIEQLQTLNKMYKNGIITEDEFKKAKNKILSK